ncbi:hypothetical protein KAS41_00375 [Candidatus Parcubacteria bacterium]|nr:hypothetical protein [Candidatus Parcubacteria bacterium]
MNLLKKSSYFKTIALTGLVFVFSLFGFTAAFGYGGGGGRPPIVQDITAVNYPLTLAAGQTGDAISNFGQRTATLHVPGDAIDQKTTFKIQMSAANANQRPAGEAYIIANKVFSITATSINNNSVTDFNEDLTITIALPDMPGNISNVKVYYLNSEAGEWILIPGASIDPATGIASFSANHLSVFSIIDGVEDPMLIAKEPKKTKTNNSGKVEVLGVEHYADGVLIRAKNKKIYVIKDGAKQHIFSMNELREYAGQPIFDVDDETLEQYGKTAEEGAKEYGNGNLLRAKNRKIYVIKDGTKQHICNMQELRKYAGQAIFDVDDETLEQYGVEVLGAEGYGDGALIRCNKDMKIYVIKDGVKQHICNMNELRKYAGQPINDVDDSVLEQY